MTEKPRSYNFRVTAATESQQVSLKWALAVPGGQMPQSIRVVRRQHTYPHDHEDGICLLDLGDMTEQEQRDQLTWTYVKRVLCLGPGTSTRGEEFRAGIVFSFAKPEREQPEKVKLTYLSCFLSKPTANELLKKTDIVLGLHDFEIRPYPFKGMANGYVLFWKEEDRPVDLKFSRLQHVESTITISSETGDTQIYLFSMSDTGLDPETVYYYSLFIGDESPKQAWVTPLGDYGLRDRLYELLPAIHKQYDEPRPGQLEGTGQLHLFMQILGSTLNEIRSYIEDLRTRHDIMEVRPDLLQYLADWIGWPLDPHSDPLTQRHDIMFAPYLYSIAGTVPCIHALVRVLAGCDCAIKEFAHNVCLTNSPDARTVIFHDEQGLKNVGYLGSGDLQDIGRYTYDTRAIENGGRYAFDVVGIFIFEDRIPFRPGTPEVRKRSMPERMLVELISEFLPAHIRVIPILDREHVPTSSVEDMYEDTQEQGR